MADGISISITEDVTSVTVAEEVTTIDITPSVTTVEAKGIALGSAGSATATAYQNSNTNLAVGSTVAEALDDINTNGFNKNANNTITGNTTIQYDRTFNFQSGATVKNAMNLGNNNITGVNHISFADAGAGEGLRWENIQIVETNDGLTANSPGDLQVTYKQSDDTYARRFTVRDTGVDVVGTITFDGGTTSQNLNFGDGIKARFGANNNLNIYFDGNHSYVYDTGPGDLRVRGNNLYLQNDTGGNYLSAINGGATTLFYNGNTTLATTNSGIDITGDLAVDKVGIGTSTPSNQLTLKSTSAGDTSGIRWDNGPESVKAYFNNGDANSDFFITYTGTNGPEIRFQHDGDIILNSGSDGKVGIGTNNPSTMLDVNGTVTATAFAGPITGNVTSTGDSSFGNITTTGYLRGPSTFTIDPAGHGDNTGKVVIAGDLQVDGTTTTINSTELTIDDKVIEVASNATNTDEANGAGLSVGGTSATLTYTALFDGWTFNKSVDINGNLLLSGGFFDSNNNNGTAGQALLSTGTATEWGDISTTLNVQADSGSTQAIEMLTENLDIAGGTGISTATTDNTVTVSLDDTAVTAGTYGAAGSIPQLTVDSQGRVTGVSNITGALGPAGGDSFEFEFSTDTSGSAPPGNVLKVNNANLTSAGILKVHKNALGSTANLNLFFDSLVDTNNLYDGTVRLALKSDPSSFVLYNFNQVSTFTTSAQMTLVYITGSVTSFADEAEVIATFTQAGTKGSNGVDGEHGALTLEYDFSSSLSYTNPSSGYIQFNKWDYTQSGMRVGISNTDRLGNDLTSTIRHLTNSTNPDVKGYLTVINKTDRTRYVVFKITNSFYSFADADDTLFSVERIAGSEGGDSATSGIATNAGQDVLVSFQRAADFGDIDTALGTSSANANEVLSWTGSAYDWVDQSGGVALTDLSVTVATAGSANLSYNNANGVFTYTPPDLSGYLTGYTETDPVVGAINGIVKADGAGNISVATGSTDGSGDYSTVKIGTGANEALAGNTALLQLGTTSTTAMAGDTKIEELYTEVDTGVNGVEAGKAYRISGWDATNSRPVVTAALASSGLPVIGFATETVASGNTTKLLIKGVLSGIDTSLQTMGGTAQQANLFPSSTTAGTLTRVPDDANSIQSVASVVVVSSNGSSDGVIMVDVSGQQHFKSLAEDKVLVGNASSEPVATDLNTLVPKIVPIIRKTTTGAISGTAFKSFANQRIIISATGDYTIFQPAAADVGKTWTLYNTTGSTIVLDFDSQYIEPLTGVNKNAVQTDWHINAGGLVELVCINSIANGGTASTPNFIIYGTGLVDV